MTTTSVSDYLAMGEDELTTLLILTDRDTDIVRHLDGKTIQRIDNNCQQFVDQFYEKNGRDPDINEWMRERARQLLIHLQAEEGEDWHGAEKTAR